MSKAMETGSAASGQSVTKLLEAWGVGDSDAAGQVLPLVYDELRSIARSYFVRERREHTLQATALVHEAYVRVVEQSGVQFKSRAHFAGDRRSTVAPGAGLALPPVGRGSRRRQ